MTDPMPGRWTALFFTELDGATGAGTSGTSGPVQWDAQTWQYAPAGSIAPRFLSIPAGQSATATLSLTTPSTAGDSDQSVVVSSDEGQTTIPVTIRSVVPIGPSGGTFTGVLTGGNGRAGAQAQANAYYFDVPSGQSDLDVSIDMANNPSAGLVAGDQLVAYLVDPNGQTVGYSSDFTLEPTSGGLETAVSPFTQLYHVAPIPGQWQLVLFWSNPVVGDELSDPFTGSIAFNQVSVSSELPDSSSVNIPALTSAASRRHGQQHRCGAGSLLCRPEVGRPDGNCQPSEPEPRRNLDQLHHPAAGWYFVPVLPGPNAHDTAPGQRVQRRRQHSRNL